MTVLAEREPSRTRPVERNVLARVHRPFELEAERIDRTDRRLAPGHDLAGTRLGAGRVHELRILSRQARRPGQGLGPTLHLAGDLGSPAAAIRCDLERDARALDAADLPAFGEERGDESRKAADLAAENVQKRPGLARIGALIDEDTRAPLDRSGPEIAFPPAHPDEAQAVEIHVAVVAAPDVPEQHRLAEAIVRRLREGARAGHRAAAMVEPVPRNAPAGRLCHRDLGLAALVLRAGCVGRNFLLLLLQLAERGSDPGYAGREDRRRRGSLSHARDGFFRLGCPLGLGRLPGLRGFRFERPPFRRRLGFGALGWLSHGSVSLR